MQYLDRVSTLSEFSPTVNYSDGGHFPLVTMGGRSDEKSLTTDSGYCATEPPMPHPQFIQHSYTQHASNISIDPSLAVSGPNSLYLIDDNGSFGAERDFRTDGNLNYQWQHLRRDLRGHFSDGVNQR